MFKEHKAVLIILIAMLVTGVAMPAVVYAQTLEEILAAYAQQNRSETNPQSPVEVVMVVDNDNSGWFSTNDKVKLVDLQTGNFLCYAIIKESNIATGGPVDLTLHIVLTDFENAAGTDLTTKEIKVLKVGNSYWLGATQSQHGLPT